jgi:hypothetical protein
MKTEPNILEAAIPAITLRFTVDYHWRGVADLERQEF